MIGKEVENQLPDPSRIAGSDRFDTAAQIIEQLGMPTDEVYVATGFEFADALTGSALAARENAPIALVRQDEVPEDIMGVIEDANSFLILGGEAAVGDSVKKVLLGEEPEEESDEEIKTPSGVWAEAVSESEILFGWDQTSDADYYKIYYAYYYDGSYNEMISEDTGKNKFYWSEEGIYLYGGEDDTTYYFKISAVKDDKVSDYSKIVSATTFPLPAQKLYLYAEDGTYLGKLTTNEYHSDSIYNEYGTYGSEYSSTSIWNEYGMYGGDYSTYSPFNDYTYSPPYIVTSDGTVVGRLTTNNYVSGAISPYEIYGILLELGL